MANEIESHFILELFKAELTLQILSQNRLVCGIKASTHNRTVTNNRSKQNESLRSNLIIVNIDKLLDTLPAGSPKFIPPRVSFIFKFLRITTKGENCVRISECKKQNCLQDKNRTSVHILLGSSLPSVSIFIKTALSGNNTF